MVLALNLHAASNLESSVRATHAKTEAFAKRAGIDSYVIALALATGHAPVREVNVSVQSCPFFVVLHKPYHKTLHTTTKSKGESQFLILTLNLNPQSSAIVVLILKKCKGCIALNFKIFQDHAWR